MMRTKKKATGALSEPRFLQPGSKADPLVVVRSDFWHYNSLGLFDGQNACVIDPGIRREDVELLAARLRWQGKVQSPRKIEQVILTHSHHDHLRGWKHFPKADIVQPAVSAYKALGARQRILASKSAIDQHLGERHSGFGYPPAHLTFEGVCDLQIGSRELQLRFLPGHSNCTSVVWIPSLRTLCTADYLVSPGLPYCRWEADAFDAALDALTKWVEEDRIERIWPSHNAPILGQTEILKAIDLDRRIMQVLRTRAKQALDKQLDDKAAIAWMVHELDSIRNWAAGRSGQQDLDNAQRVLDAVRKGLGAGKGPQSDQHGNAPTQHDRADAQATGHGTTRSTTNGHG